MLLHDAKHMYTRACALFRGFRAPGTDRDRIAPKVQEGRGPNATLVLVSLGASEESVVGALGSCPAVVACKHEQRVRPHSLWYIRYVHARNVAATKAETFGGWDV